MTDIPANEDEPDRSERDSRADAFLEDSLDAPTPAKEARHRPADELVLARQALLDALDAIQPHAGALILVGAQAIYEHTKHYQDAPPTSTHDGDMSVDTTLVAETPSIAEALRQAGFATHKDRPGIWLRPDGTAIDLLAPEATAGSGRRSAHVAGQEKTSIGRAAGLEMALLDHQPMTIFSLDPRTPERAHTINVAGPAALFCAKSYKLGERIAEKETGGRDRVKPKDAGDLWRLMAVTNPREVRAVFDRCEQHPSLGAATHSGRQYLTATFTKSGEGIELAIQDLEESLSSHSIVALIETWIQSFIDAT